MAEVFFILQNYSNAQVNLLIVLFCSLNLHHIRHGYTHNYDMNSTYVYECVQWATTLGSNADGMPSPIIKLDSFKIFEMLEIIFLKNIALHIFGKIKMKMFPTYALHLNICCTHLLLNFALHKYKLH